MRAEALQIVREALSNVARHSNATRANVSLTVEGGTVTIAVADNGRGFDPSAVPGGDHQGLSNMRIRAAELGGELAITSAPGQGTRIVLGVPVLAGRRVPSPTERAQA